MSLKSKFHPDLFFFESGDTEVLKVARDKEVNYLNLLKNFYCKQNFKRVTHSMHELITPQDKMEKG